GARRLDRPARRGLPVDPRSVSERPAVRDAAPDGRLDVRDAADDAQYDGPRAAAHHDADAADAGDDVLLGPGGLEPVLAGLQPVLDRAAGDHVEAPEGGAARTGQGKAAAVKDRVFEGASVTRALEAAS